jgi:hypothetical protein
MTTLIVVLIIVSVLGALLTLINEKKRHQYTYKQTEYLLTKAEQSFDRALRSAVENRARICPKVRIADILKPNPHSMGAFLSISQKHFDWVLVNSETAAIICAIELDDRSHQSEKTKKRDGFVEGACTSADLTLVRFPARMTYSIEEVRKTIETALKIDC